MSEKTPAHGTRNSYSSSEEQSPLFLMAQLARGLDNQQSSSRYSMSDSLARNSQQLQENPFFESSLAIMPQTFQQMENDSLIEPTSPPTLTELLPRGSDYQQDSNALVTNKFQIKPLNPKQFTFDVRDYLPPEYHLRDPREPCSSGSIGNYVSGTSHYNNGAWQNIGGKNSKSHATVQVTNDHVHTEAFNTKKFKEQSLKSAEIEDRKKFDSIRKYKKSKEPTADQHKERDSKNDAEKRLIPVEPTMVECYQVYHKEGFDISNLGDNVEVITAAKLYKHKKGALSKQLLKDKRMLICTREFIKHMDGVRNEAPLVLFDHRFFLVRTMVPSDKIPQNVFVRSVPRNPLKEPPLMEEVIDIVRSTLPNDKGKHPKADKWPEDFDYEMIEYWEDPYWEGKIFRVPDGVKFIPEKQEDLHTQPKKTTIIEVQMTDETAEGNNVQKAVYKRQPSILGRYLRKEL